MLRDWLARHLSEEEKKEFVSILDRYGLAQLFSPKLAPTLPAKL